MKFGNEKDHASFVRLFPFSLSNRYQFQKIERLFPAHESYSIQDSTMSESRPPIRTFFRSGYGMPDFHVKIPPYHRDVGNQGEDGGKTDDRLFAPIIV